MEHETRGFCRSARTTSAPLVLKEVSKFVRYCVFLDEVSFRVFVFQEAEMHALFFPQVTNEAGNAKCFLTALMDE